MGITSLVCDRDSLNELLKVASPLDCSLGLVEANLLPEPALDSLAQIRDALHGFVALAPHNLRVVEQCLHDGVVIPANGRLGTVPEGNGEGVSYGGGGGTGC